MTITMEQLFATAEREGLWFYTSYQGLWFSPAQLRAHQANGRFRWGPVNWQLRDPQERVKAAEAAVESAQKALDRIRREVEPAAEPSNG